jgi:predicted aconitase with swiveling domain
MYKCCSYRKVAVNIMTEKGKKIVLNGRGVVGGVAEGNAIVLKKSLSFWSGLNPQTGTLGRGQVSPELVGESVKGKVLVYPFGKGSTAGGAILFWNCMNGFAPAAIINNRLDTVVANGVISSKVPTVIELDQDPCQIIKTGDFVKVDADKGIVEVTRME